VASGIYPNMIDVGKATKTTIPNLAGGVVYYFTIKTYNVLGLASLYSNEISTMPQTANFLLTIGNP
jgi:hypothetical protein